MSRLWDLGRRPWVRDPLPAVTEVVYEFPDGNRFGLLLRGEPDLVFVQRLAPDAAVRSKLRVWDRRLLFYIDEHGLSGLKWVEDGWARVR